MSSPHVHSHHVAAEMEAGENIFSVFLGGVVVPITTSTSISLADIVSQNSSAVLRRVEQASHGSCTLYRHRGSAAATSGRKVNDLPSHSQAFSEEIDDEDITFDQVRHSLSSQKRKRKQKYSLTAVVQSCYILPNLLDGANINSACLLIFREVKVTV